MKISIINFQKHLANRAVLGTIEAFTSVGYDGLIAALYPVNCSLPLNDSLQLFKHSAVVFQVKILKAYKSESAGRICDDAAKVASRSKS